MIWEGGECSHTTEEAIGVSQSAMSVGPGSIRQIHVVQPLSSLSQYPTLSNNSRRFDSRDGHETWCKIAVADFQHSARKGDALSLMSSMP